MPDPIYLHWTYTTSTYTCSTLPELFEPSSTQTMEHQCKFHRRVFIQNLIQQLHALVYFLCYTCTLGQINSSNIYYPLDAMEMRQRKNL